MSTGWNSPTSRRAEYAEYRQGGISQPIPLPPRSPRDQPRRRPRFVSPTIARYCNPSTVAGAYPPSPALLQTCIFERGSDNCPEILGVGTQFSLRGFGREIKASPIDQEQPLPSMNAPASVSAALHRYQFFRGGSSSSPRTTIESVASLTPQTGGMNRVDHSVRRRSEPFVVGHQVITRSRSQRPNAVGLLPSCL